METTILELQVQTGQEAKVLVQVAHLDVKIIVDGFNRVGPALHVDHLCHQLLFFDYDLLFLLELAVNLRRDVIDTSIDDILVRMLLMSVSIVQY